MVHLDNPLEEFDGQLVFTRQVIGSGDLHGHVEGQTTLPSCMSLKLLISFRVKLEYHFPVFRLLLVVKCRGLRYAGGVDDL